MKKLEFLSDRQQRLFIIFFAVLLAFATLLFVVTSRASPTGSPGAIAETAAITGEWTARPSSKRADQIQISFSRTSDKGGFNMMGETFALGDLQGLTVAAVTSPRTEVSFSIAREAGSIACEGYFREGSGVGFWTFTPSQAFASAMKARGYGYLNDDEMLRAAFNDLTSKYIDELKSAGYGDLEFKQLIRAAGHEISVAYIRELGSAGQAGLTMDELIRARNHDIDGAYIKEVRAMGFDKESLEKLIRLKNHDITQDFINKMKSAGFDNLNIDGLIRLKNHEITPEFINEIKAEGYGDLSPDTAIRLKNHEIDRDFIRRAKAQGYTNVSLDELIRLRNRGTLK